MRRSHCNHEASLQIYWHKLLACALVCASLFAVLLCCMPVVRAESVRKVVRVAYPIQPGLTEITESGAYSGYTYEYLEEIAQYTGWEYEYVQVPGTMDQQLSKLMEMLANGELDLMGGMLYSEAMDARYDYSHQSYGLVETVLQTTPDNVGNIHINNFEERVLRVATRSTQGRLSSDLEAYSEQHNFTVEYVLCSAEGSTDATMYEAVAEGRADALLNTSMNPIPDAQTVARFGAVPFHFITGEGRNGALLNELDRVLGKIKEATPQFASDLSDKYFSSPQTATSLTDEEVAYIAQRDPVIVGVLKDNPPYNTEIDGVQHGIMADLAALLEEKTGLRFVLRAADSSDQVMEWARSGEIDLLANMTSDYTVSRNYNTSLTRPYLSSPFVLISSSTLDMTNLEQYRLAYIDLSYLEHNEVPENHIDCDSLAESVHAVRSGQADYAYIDSYSAQFYANMLEYAKLQIIPLEAAPRTICFGLSMPVDDVLLGILNKAIQSLSMEEIQACITPNVTPEQRFTLTAILTSYPLLVPGIAAVLIAFLALLAYQSIRSAHRMRVEMRKRAYVYALTQDYFFEYTYQRHRLHVSYPDEPSGEMREHICDESFETRAGAVTPFFELLHDAKDGTFEIHDYVRGFMQWLRVSMKVIFSDAGKPLSCVGKINFIDDEKRERDALITQSEQDALTGLYNAGVLQSKVEEALTQDVQGGALLILDIDHFKLINDTYGHMEGDRALYWLSDLIKKHFRSDDIIGRYGGDEFLVYLRNIPSAATLRKLGAQLCNTVRQQSGVMKETLTISAGAVLAPPGSAYADLFRAADYALYKAKAAGRNQVYVLEDASAVDADAPEQQSVQWLSETQYQIVLRATRLIAFDYNPVTKEQHCSPFINEFIAGNYDGRLLSQVMLEDNVVHPDDVQKAIDFRDQLMQGNLGDMTLRLLTPQGTYNWFKMRMCPYQQGETQLFTGFLSDVDDEIRQKEVWRYRAEFDTISGIYNKTSFFERTEDKLRCEPDTTHYLLRFDVERFKLINEIYSATEGDRVLQFIGSVVRDAARPGETFGRWGNDVFCMCLTRTREEVIALVGEMEARINQYPLEFQFLLSAGILEISRYRGEAINVLCDHAACAQRTIKGNYAKQYAFYDDELGRALTREHRMTMRMTTALEEGQFVLYLQPKYNIRTRSITGAEALVRWIDPDEGMIPPGDFIPLFERNNFILRLDEYVWTLTCRRLRKWLDEGRKPMPISVNVSRLHIQDPGFCDKLTALVKQYDLPPSLLELEITESAYAQSPQALYEVMDTLRERGFVFLMDDFGSGYSSLSVLKDIPVAGVKIDLNFLRHSRYGDESARNVLRGSIQLVQGMHLPIVVEGIETREQENFLLELGCEYAQGYLYARPMPVEQYEQLIADENPPTI